MAVSWEVWFYQTARGESPIEDFVAELPTKARGKCTAYFEQLEEHGFDLPRSFIAKVRGNIWELRPDMGGAGVPILLCGDGRSAVRGAPRDQEEVAESEIERDRIGGISIC